MQQNKKKKWKWAGHVARCKTTNRLREFSDWSPRIERDPEEDRQEDGELTSYNIKAWCGRAAKDKERLKSDLEGSIQQ